MDMQTFIDNQMKARRADVLAKSDQLTLGEMILKMEAILAKTPERNSELLVWYDFEYLFPNKIDSWRGSYSELALNFAGHSDADGKPLNSKQFHELLTNAVGAIFTGYKGGDFIMSKHTPVWVSNYGNAANTAVIDIIDAGYKVVIMTAYREY